MNTWVIEVVGSPPPRPDRVHWGRVSKLKRQWTEYIAFYAISRKIPKCEAQERRHIEVVFFRPGPVSDEDNAHAACKIPLDALKRAGLIEDDSPRCIDLTVSTVSSGKSFTRITLTRL